MATDQRAIATATSENPIAANALLTSPLKWKSARPMSVTAPCGPTCPSSAPGASQPDATAAMMSATVPKA